MVLLSFLMYSGRSADNEKTLCAGVAFHASEEISAAVQRYAETGSALRVALERNPSLDEGAIRAISSSILRSMPFVTGVSTAPSAIVRYHFPEAGNESLIGHDLLSNPERRDSLTRAVELRTPVVSGPFESVEGSSALFLRYPVFSGEKLWGFTSLTIDFDAMIDTFGLDRHYPGFSFAFSDEAGYGVAQDVVLPGATWQIRVKPSRGWAALDPFLYVMLLAGLAGAALLFISFRARAGGEGGHAEPGLSKGGRSVPGPAVPAPRDRAARTENLSALEVAVRAAREMGPTASPESATLGERAPAAPVQSLPSADSSSVDGARVAGASADSPQPLESAAKTGDAPEAPMAAAGPIPENESPSRKGREVKFLGPDVKGQLYMPDILFQGDPSLLFAASAKDRTSAQPAQQPLPRPEKSATSSSIEPQGQESPRHPGPKPAGQRPVYPAARRQEFLFSLEEEPVKAEVAILVVDDSEANRDIVGRMLSLRGYKADFAASGEAAIELCANRHYSIIFMDCFMPGMDGYRTSSLLRAAHPEAGATIVGLSARVGDQELERCKKAGMDDLLAKPFTLKQLLAHIEKR